MFGKINFVDSLRVNPEYDVIIKGNGTKGLPAGTIIATRRDVPSNLVVKTEEEYTAVATAYKKMYAAMSAEAKSEFNAKLEGDEAFKSWKKLQAREAWMMKRREEKSRNRLAEAKRSEERAAKKSEKLPMAPAEETKPTPTEISIVANKLHRCRMMSIKLAKSIDAINITLHKSKMIAEKVNFDADPWMAAMDAETRHEYCVLLGLPDEAKANHDVTMYKTTLAKLNKRLTNVEKDIDAFVSVLAHEARRANNSADSDDKLVAMLANEALDAHRNPKKYAKEPAVKLLGYKTPVITLENLFPENILKAMAQVRRGDPAPLTEIEDWEIKLPRKPFFVNADTLATKAQRQSIVPEIIGVRFGRMTRLEASLDHRLYTALKCARWQRDVSRKVAGRNMGPEERLSRIITRVLDRFEKDGISIDYPAHTVTEEEVVLNYHIFTASNSGVGKGICVLIEDGCMNEHRQAFAMMQADKMASIMTDAGDRDKCRNLGKTPSKIFEYEDGIDPETGDPIIKRLHVRDIVMLKSIVLEYKLHEGDIFVGDGTQKIVLPFTGEDGKTRNVSTTIDVTVNKNTGVLKIHALEGWDGGMFYNGILPIPNFQARQAFGMKAHITSIGEIPEMLAEVKPQYKALLGRSFIVKDFDDEMVEIKPGQIITTDTTWKAKKIFKAIYPDHAWMHYVEACEELAKYYDGYDCIRIVSAAEDEETMETNRKMSRQFIQQFVLAKTEELKELIKMNIRSTKDFRKAIGAIKYLMGEGKNMASLSQLEWLFRLIPQLAGNDKVQRYMLSRYLDKIADLATGKLLTKEITLFMVQDPSAFVEHVFFGADIHDPDLGLLKAGEISTPSMEDGQEAVALRFPANWYSMSVVTNREVPAFECCGNAIIINIHDDLIIRWDGDMDGDHLAVFLSRLLIDMAKENAKIMKKMGLSGVVIFHHANGGKQQLGTDEWMADSHVELMKNGMQFSMIGQCSYGAMKAYAKMSDLLAQAKLAQRLGYIKEAKENIELAKLWALVAIENNVGTIDTIDWRKKAAPMNDETMARLGLDKNETEEERIDRRRDRKIFDFCMLTTKISGEFKDGVKYGTQPWFQHVRKHTPETPFYKLSQLKEHDSANEPGRKWYSSNFWAPTQSVLDRLVMLVYEAFDIDYDGVTGQITVNEAMEFDSEGIEFDPSMIGWKPHTFKVNGVDREQTVCRMTVDKHLVRWISCQINGLNNCVRKEDADIKECLQDEKAVGVIPFLKYLWRRSAACSARLQRDQDEACALLEAECQTKAMYTFGLAALYSMVSKNDIPMSWYDADKNQHIEGYVTDIDEKMDIVVDWALEHAFEWNGKASGSFSLKGVPDYLDGEAAEKAAFEAQDEKDRKKAEFAMFVLNVVAPWLTARIEKRYGDAKKIRISDDSWKILWKKPDTESVDYSIVSAEKFNSVLDSDNNDLMDLF